MKKVLIYGFGWTGQSMLQLCVKIGFECKVLDDNINLDFTQDDIFIDQKGITENFDIYFVCIINKESAKEAYNKLKDAGIPKVKIKFISTYGYKNKMAFLVREYFKEPSQVLKKWLEDDQSMTYFHSQMKAMLNEYYQIKKSNADSLLEWSNKIRSTMIGQTIFAKLYTSALIKSDLAHIAYPGFNIGISFEKKEDKNFYFVQKIDFEAIMQRPKDVKLVACFGNSALRVEYLPLEDTITAFLQKKLGKKYIVLNFGVTGYTIYEQMMLYNALVFPLKPEIVISCFGGTDWRTGIVSCEHLVKTHKMTYTPGFYEYAYKKVTKSELPLYSEIGNDRKDINNNILDDDVNEAIAFWLRQFNLVPRGGGGAFYAFIQPLLPCKLKWTKEEKEMRDKERKLLEHTLAYQNEIIDNRILKYIAGLKDKIRDCDFVFDLNEIFHKSEESIFTNHWIHCNAKGNEMVAEKIFEVLKQKGIVR